MSVSVNSNEKMLVNSAIGMTASGVTSLLPVNKVNIIKAVSPRTAVKAARKTTPIINRVTESRIIDSAFKKQKIAKVVNPIPSTLINNISVGAPTEVIKRKVDKAMN